MQFFIVHVQLKELKEEILYYESDQLRILLKIQPTLIAIFIFLSVSPVKFFMKLLRHLLVKLELLLNIHLIFHIFSRHVICHFIYFLLFFFCSLFLLNEFYLKFYSLNHDRESVINTFRGACEIPVILFQFNLLVHKHTGN